MAIEKVTDDAHLPITISIDVDALLTSELGWTPESDWDGPTGEYSPGGNGRMINVVANVLAMRLHDSVKSAVTEAVKESAVAKVDVLIDEVMSGDLTLTTQYGERRGQPMSMREAMIAAMSDRLDAKVDEAGRRQTDNYGRSMSYLEWHTEKVARQVIDKDMNTRLSDAAKKIKEAATDLVGKRIAEVLGRGF